MRVPPPESLAYRLLYTGIDGEVIGLDEVQLLDAPSPARIGAVTALLDEPDLFIRYQAILVLTAWGIDAGMAAAEAMLANAGSDDGNLAPHRINGQDNRFDELAEAVHLYLVAGGDRGRALNYFRALLPIYPSHFFESKFKRALLNHADAQMAAPVEAATLTAWTPASFIREVNSCQSWRSAIRSVAETCSCAVPSCRQEAPILRRTLPKR